MSTTDKRTSAVAEGVLWTEKYRPTSLDAVALEPETRQLLTAYLEAGEIPHLLFVGPPGSGKTTIARLLIDALDCRHITLNASLERGIDTVRIKIGAFVAGLSKERFNVVFLDEADEMTADAQTGLRNQIESFSERARFILTANKGHRVIAPIQSRCQVITVGRPPLKERYRVLAQIMQAENIEATPQVLLGYADHYPDMRRMLFAVQRAFLSSTTGALPAVMVAVTDGSELFTRLLSKEWGSFTRITTSGEFDPMQALRELFFAVPDDHPKAAFIRHKLGRGVHECGFTPDPIVLFLAVVAEVMDGV